MKTIPLPRNQLSAEIKNIFDFLLEVNKEQRVGAVLRVAGGWVRDTLLGIPSHDVDIAIETIATDPPTPLVTGEVFTSSIAQYQAARQLPTNTISVIRTNPEKSKHIETAQMTVMGMPLEFCHLRHDDYTSCSRVPTVRPGTPLEDALRRDYTVNALFYNLHTEMVEDFTTGLCDMDAKILRTPLAPHETFLDDPLRLLRGIRFSGQLAYTLAPEVVTCARDPIIIKMMRDKVSRERIGIEFGKMMGGNHPSYCCGLLLETNLLHNTILQEVYYKKGKGKSVTNDIEFIRSLVPSSTYASEEGLLALNAALRLWSVDRLELLIRALAVGKGLDRVAISCVSMLMPLLLSGVLEDVVSASPTHGPASTMDERIAAFVMMGLKQPSIVADNVSRMLQSVRILLRAEATEGLDLVAALREQHIAAVEGSSSASHIFAVGRAREVVFELLCQLSTKTMIEEGPYVAMGTFLLARGVAPDEVFALLALMRRDVNLIGAPTGAVPLRGEDVSTSVGVEKKKIATYIMAQRRFLLHQPTATREDVIEYLKTLSL